MAKKKTKTAKKKILAPRGVSTKIKTNPKKRKVIMKFFGLKY